MWTSEFNWGYIKAVIDKVDDYVALSAFNKLYKESHPEIGGVVNDVDEQDVNDGLQVGDVVKVVLDEDTEYINKKAVVVAVGLLSYTDYNTEVAFTESLFGLHEGSNRCGFHYRYYKNCNLRRV